MIKKHWKRLYLNLQDSLKIQTEFWKDKNIEKFIVCLDLYIHSESLITDDYSKIRSIRECWSIIKKNIIKNKKINYNNKVD